MVVSKQDFDDDSNDGGMWDRLCDLAELPKTDEVNELPDMINGFFEENEISDEFDVTDNPVKHTNCDCCQNHKPVHECTDINKKIFFLCEDCLSLAEG